MNLVALWPILAIAAAVLLGLLGFVILALAGVWGYKLIQSRRAAKRAQAAAPALSLPGLIGGVGKIASSPFGQELDRLLAPVLIKYQQDVLNAALLKLFPPLAPYLPLIDGELLKIEKTVLQNIEAPAKAA